MGGNGKTPMVEYLIRLLKSEYRVAVISRGYGRSSSGFIIASSTHTASDIGDEPLQLYRKFTPDIKVAVGESRALAIPEMLLENPEVNLIILDDAFQHRTVDPQAQVLVTDYHNPFFKDHVFPSGRLRESRKNISRADVVVVTKCPPDISSDQRTWFEAQIKKYCELPVFFSTIQYQQPCSFSTGEALVEFPPVLLVTGIAKPDPLVKYISNRYKLLEHLQFKDHHNYSGKELEEIKDRFLRFTAESPVMLTTEKDMVRLIPHQKLLKDLPIFYMPIESVFIEDEDRFNSLILNHIENNKELESD
jgi:tetraacyldisaccharide 4'-kinase